jgi:hypothetical protein
VKLVDKEAHQGSDDHADQGIHRIMHAQVNTAEAHDQCPEEQKKHQVPIDFSEQ